MPKLYCRYAKCLNGYEWVAYLILCNVIDGAPTKIRLKTKFLLM